MRLTLELTETQARLLQSALEDSLQSLVLQEIQLNEALKDYEKIEALPNTETEINNIQNYLSNITAQRVLLAEIIHTMMEAEKKTQIITNLL